VPREQLVAINGLTLGCTDAGCRAPLLLVHAWPLDSALWAPQVAAFADTRRVIAPDLAGFGRSGPEGRSTIDGHADDLVALLDALSVARAVVVGLSMGGYVALALAHRHPGRVAALVLAATRATADDPGTRESRTDLARRLAIEGLGPLRVELLPRLVATTAPEHVRAAAWAIMARQPVAGVTAALAAMADRADSRPWLAAIAVPTLVMVGSQDVITPPSAAEALAGAIRGARLVRVPGAGHLASLEEPGAFNAAVRAFLAEVDAASG